MSKLKTKVQDTKYFCILPWIHFHAWPDKKVMPCCVADSEKPVARLSDEETLLDVMNSEEYKKMRLAMLNDEPYEPCRRCYDLEDVGIWSLRQSQNVVRGENNLDLVEATNEDGSIDEFKMKYMDIRFSNLCNFKCRSCGPGCSSLWGEEKLKIVGEGEWVNNLGREPVISNNESGVFMEQLKPYLSDVEECYFAGGEILVTPEHYECLDYWINTDTAKDVKLSYTTNMSKISYTYKREHRDLFELWKHFKEVEIWASIDAIGLPGEIIRKGFRWEKIKQNLMAIKERAPYIRIGITPTVSTWNVFEYTKMFDWMYDNGFISEEIAPRVNLLTYPDRANIQCLPKSVRVELIQEFKEYALRFEDTTHIRNGFKMLIHTLWKGEDNKEKVKEFFEDNIMLDELRNESLFDAIPKLKEIYEWTKT